MSEKDKNSMDSKTLDLLEAELRKRHQVLAQEMHSQADIIKQPLPQDSEDASQVKEEIEIRQLEDAMEENEIHLIEEALDRINKGEYGSCLGCSETIHIERLLALPYTKYCVSCQEKREK